MRGVQRLTCSVILVLLATRTQATAVDLDEASPSLPDAQVQALIDAADDEYGSLDDFAGIAEPTAKQLTGLHAKLDTDGDGVVSVHELMVFELDMHRRSYVNHSMAMASRIDTSHDGTVSLVEALSDMGFESGAKSEDSQREEETQKFMMADTNGDGVLEMTELPAFFYPSMHEGVLNVVVNSSMHEKDTNSDGRLTPGEFWGLDSSLANMSHGSNAFLDYELDTFAKLDKDNDGTIDMHELREWDSGKFEAEADARELVKLADKNNDSVVDSQELAQASHNIAKSRMSMDISEWLTLHEL